MKTADGDKAIHELLKAGIILVGGSIASRDGWSGTFSKVLTTPVGPLPPRQVLPAKPSLAIAKITCRSNPLIELD
jgi:hypothetical protein